jgi:hypothetical protein
MFEITSEDIALLNDEDLRSLVGRLCESEMRKRGISPSCVTWGGDQRAADAGIDVRVALPPSVEIQGFIPRPETGFQVKTEDLTPGKVASEMCPKGVLRSAIRDLVEKRGAYVIISSRGSTSHAALQNRIKAMRNALGDIPTNSITVDFYDRKRIETWLRDHPSQVPWVRERIGKPLQGWSSYGAWAYAAETVSAEYLPDTEIRVRGGKETKNPGLSVVGGIERIRSVLDNPRGVVRLVGVSGIGKTRLAQALFDDRVGQNGLDPVLALYTNIGDSPNPQPLVVAAELVGSGKRAILVVDNCPPDLHNRLSEICRTAGSMLSVITIEYDIREDQPEGTGVFTLEAGSANLIERLIRYRFPQISHVNLQRIAEFSGGNARIAIALAGTIDQGETIAQLPDYQLFIRLFEQRHGADEALLLAAQALSLVYSFDGENVSEDEQAELSPLGTLVGKSAQEMFRHCAELERRRLVQRRGRWRAILPHAIADRLASMALQNIPPNTIESTFNRADRERLLKSFSRRVGYLNGNREAQSIAQNWLGADGLLRSLPDFNDLGHTLFRNIAPTDPEETLRAFERVLRNPADFGLASRCNRYLRLLRSLAYDPVLFERCTTLMVTIAEATNVNDDEEHEDVKIFASLFPMCFSGTHATIEQRLGVLKGLLFSSESKKRTLGVAGLSMALEARHFGSAWEFEFGAHSRDYGLWPRTRGDIERWFSSTLKLAEEIACSDHPAAPTVAKVLVAKFRNLWSSAGMYGDLERVFRRISDRKFWVGGWVAIRQTIHYDSNGIAPEISARLASLEASLRPENLVQKVRAIVLTEGLLYIGINASVDDTTDPQKSLSQVQTTAHELGKAVATNEESLMVLLPDLLTGNSEQLWSFGAGLAEASPDHRAIWDKSIAQLRVTPNDKQNVQVLRGFLSALNNSNPDLVSKLLDDAVGSDELGFWYPLLQTAVGIDKKGVERLINSIQVGKTNIRMFRNLLFGGVTHPICGPDFNRLLTRIAEEENGLDVAIELLTMRLSFDEGRRNSSPSELIDVGCDLMRRVSFAGRRTDVDSYRLGIVARQCLVGQKGAAAVREICHNLKGAISKSQTYAFYHAELLQMLAGTQPLALLDGLCGGDQTDLSLGVTILEQASQLRRNPFDAIPEADLIGWCDQNPEIRYPAVARGVTPFQQSGDTGRPAWTNLARKLIEKAHDRVAVLRGFMDRFIPVVWSGSRTDIIESNAKLLNELAIYCDSALDAFIAEEKARLAVAIKAEQTVEHFLNRPTDERFE